MKIYRLLDNAIQGVIDLTEVSIGKKEKIVELLVPAGGEKQFIAAVENGADAVYIGGRMFNARMNAGNFDDELMVASIDYAHIRGVKVFVTMNTLIKDDELAEALEYARFLYQSGVDALIIQDLGFGALVKKSLPDMEIHLSTQATCCDVESLKVAHELGYDRVVPARELSLVEIKNLCDTGLCDIEIFVHGAMCICYSGQCQLSRFYGGRSGNRGSCAQPCRLPYNKEGEHPLSPKDMCQIDNIGRLIDAGVYSFKIEGRMKSPEYVAVVTSIYRKYIDLYLRDGSYVVTEEDRNSLLQIFNRGKFTQGYLDGNPGKKLMSMVVPKNQGIKVGSVTGIKKESTLVDVKLSDGYELEIGDGVEIRSRKSMASTVLSYMKPLGDGRYRIGDFKDAVRLGDAVYRTSEKRQLKVACATFEGKSVAGDGTRPLRKRLIDMRLSQADAIDTNGTVIDQTGAFDTNGTARIDQTGAYLKLEVRTAVQGDDADWDSMRQVSASVLAGPFEQYESGNLSNDRFIKALSKLGNTPFEIRNLEFSTEISLNAKMSELNDLRRRAIEELENKLRFRRSLDKGDALSDNLVANYKKAGYEFSTNKEDYYFNLKDYLKAKGQNRNRDAVALIPLADICLRAKQTGQNMEDICEPGIAIPYISNVSKGLEDSIIESNYGDCVKLTRKTGVYVGNLGWLKRFADEGVIVTADYGLNAYNSVTAEVLRSLGASNIVASLESMPEGENIYPLMVSEHRFEEDRYISKMGHRLKVIKREYSNQDIVVPIISEGRYCSRRYI